MNNTTNLTYNITNEFMTESLALSIANNSISYISYFNYYDVLILISLITTTFLLHKHKYKDFWVILSFIPIIVFFFGFVYKYFLYKEITIYTQMLKLIIGL